MKGLPRSLGRANPANNRVADNAMLHSLAKIAASSVTALTDNSGGATANGTIEAIGNVTAALLGSNDAVQTVSGAAAMLTAKDALKELMAQTQAINAVVPALGGTLTHSAFTGTAPDKTIGAITVNASGVGTAMASYGEIFDWFEAITERISQLRYHVNKICVACGVGPLADALGVVASQSLTFDEVAAISDDTATGLDDEDPQDAIVKIADFNAKMVLVANAVKEIATKLNACHSATGGVMGAVATE